MPPTRRTLFVPVDSSTQFGQWAWCCQRPTAARFDALVETETGEPLRVARLQHCNDCGRIDEISY